MVLLGKGLARADGEILLQVVIIYNFGSKEEIKSGRTYSMRIIINNFHELQLMFGINLLRILLLTRQEK